MTPSQKRILIHTLGLDYSSEPYRNHYCTEEGCSSWANVQALVELGYLEQTFKATSGLLHYAVTPPGMVAVGVSNYSI